MKVKCILLIDPVTGQQVEENGSLTRGKTYDVLSVLIKRDGDVKFRIMNDENIIPPLFEADQFEVMSNKLPPNWIADYEVDEFFELAPKSWTAPGFWERYFDDDPPAIEEFERERKIILQSEA